MLDAEVVVVGSLNQDITVETDRRPSAGETVLGRTVATASGGKGANQAVAAARAGARTAMVGCVGADAAGEALLAGLRAAGVDVAAVRALDDAPSGTALIVVDAAGENSIVVVPGANARLSAADVEAALGGAAPAAQPEAASADALGGAAPAVPDAADVEAERAGAAPAAQPAAAAAGALTGAARPLVLAQLEVAEEVVLAAARAARRFVLNASPVRELPDELLAAADPLIVNAGEAAALTGADAADPRALAAAAHERGVRSIVITLGERGALWSVAGSTTIEVPARRVKVVDTTGAGDVFAGTLAAHLSRGDDREKALQAAVEAGAAAVGWHGAQEPR